MLVSHLVISTLLWSFANAIFLKRDESSFKYISGPFRIGGFKKVPAIDFEIGTPGQKLQGILDTGSSITYVDSAIFDPKKSSTYHNTSVKQSTRFVGISDKGWWSYDAASWGSTSIKNFSFAYNPDRTRTGTIVGVDIFQNNRTLLTSLKEGGAISNRSFALYYANPENFSGEYIFGGVDKSKFIGKLAQLPYHHLFERGNYSVIQDDGVVYVNHSSAGVMFDTGGSGTCYFPKDTLQYILDHYGDGNSVDCQKIRDEKPKIQFEVGGAWNFTYDIESLLHSPLCTTENRLRLIQTESNTVPLGPEIFQQAYVVWDYDNRRMLFGKRNPNPGKADIVPISDDLISN